MLQLRKRTLTTGSRKSAAQRKQDHEHSMNVFHPLMLQDKLRSAVRWITERNSSELLSPMDMTKAKTTAGDTAEVCVTDAFFNKASKPRTIVQRNLHPVLYCDHYACIKHHWSSCPDCCTPSPWFSRLWWC